MSLRLLPVLLAGLLALAGCQGADGPSGGTPGAQMSPGELAMALEVFDLVNQERAVAGVAPLAWDDGAAQVAYEHSVDMDVRDFFSHTNPDGEEPWDRLTAAGISWSAAGENIAYGQPDPVSVMIAWMNSPGHRDNILRTSFTRLGVGVHDAPGGPWWTQLFFAP